MEAQTRFDVAVGGAVSYWLLGEQIEIPWQTRFEVSVLGVSSNSLKLQTRRPMHDLSEVTVGALVSYSVIMQVVIYAHRRSVVNVGAAVSNWVTGSQVE